MKSSRRSFLLNPLSMLLAGLLLGIAARLFDIYFQNLGEIFSQMAIWMAKEPGAFSKIIAAGIAAVSVMSSVLLFDHLRLYDFVIDGVLIYILFFKKIKRSQKRKDWNE